MSEEIGIAYPTLERTYVAFAAAPNTRRACEEDLRLIRFIPVLFGAGVSEGEVLRLARVGRQCSTDRAVPEPLPAPLDRGAVPPTRPPR